jgi:hypothetical protein
MPDYPSTHNGQHSQDEALNRLIETKVNEAVEKAQIGQNDTRKKSWKRSWKSASPLTKLALIVSAVVMLATIANSIAAGIQSFSSAKQLHEMKSGGQQTDHLISLYREQLSQLTKQAEDIKRLANQAKLQAEKTGALAVTARLQARAANKSADTAKKTLEAQISRDRAILDIQNINLVQVQQGMFTVAFTLSNSGPTPAINVNYVMSGPYSIVWDRGYHRESVERIVTGLHFSKDYTPRTHHDVGGRESAPPISINVNVPRNEIAAMNLMDDADFVYGLLRFDDIYGGKWVRPFCIWIFNESVDPLTHAYKFKAEDCNISQEILSPRND